MSNVIAIASVVSEIWLATDRQTDRQTHTHSLLSSVKFAKSMTLLHKKRAYGRAIQQYQSLYSFLLYNNVWVKQKPFQHTNKKALKYMIFLFCFVKAGRVYVGVYVCSVMFPHCVEVYATVWRSMCVQGYFPTVWRMCVQLYFPGVVLCVFSDISPVWSMCVQ